MARVGRRKWHMDGKAARDVQPADFRALRESLGLSQRNVAEAAGVQVLAVKRWESGDRTIPAEVWHWLRTVGEESDKAVIAIVQRTFEQINGQRNPVVWLQYYRDQADYDSRRDDGDPYGLANANARKVASRLSRHGVICRFCYPPRGQVEVKRQEDEPSAESRKSKKSRKS